MNYTTAWLVWIVMFFAIEVPAIFNKQEGDTLSEHIWKWFSVNVKSKGWRIRRIGLMATFCWIVVHLFTGGWV